MAIAHCVVSSLSRVLSGVGEQSSEEGPEDGGRVTGGTEYHAQALAEVTQLLPHVLHCLHVAQVKEILMTPRL